MLGRTVSRKLLLLGAALAAAAAITGGCDAQRPRVAAVTDAKDAGRFARAPDAAIEARITHPVNREEACQGDHALREREESRKADREARASYPALPPESEDGFADFRGFSKDRCVVAENNIEGTIKAILSETAPAPKPASAARWNGTSEPLYLSRVNERFHLSADERRALGKNGFFASDRMEADSYGSAFHDIFQSELPVYVSMDALFQAVFAAHDGLLADIESGRLQPALEELLARMSCALPDAAKDYPEETARDLDLYISVARMLLRQAHGTVLGDEEMDDLARMLSGLAEEGTSMRGADGSEPVVLFGRPRVIDFTQYTPRGHYASSPLMLDSYFRAVMWLSRLELNVKTRDGQSSQPGATADRSETPREAQLALALADLAERSGALPLIELMDQAFALLAGRREDLSVRDVLALRKKAGIASLRGPNAASQLTSAIGNDFERTARMHYMPEGVKELPAIMTLLGPRVTTDTSALRALVHDEMPERFMVTPADVGFLMGHDRAKAYMTRDLATFPGLGGALLKSRADMATRSGTDLYGAWLRAARATAEPQGEGAFPSFTSTDAYKDMTMNTAIAAFGQIRHNHVLLAGQAYDAYGCTIPDGYVEPAPKVLDALIAYAERGKSAMASLDPSGMSEGGAYFDKLGRVLSALRMIVSRELAGEPLRPEEKRFLSLVAEYEPRDPMCTDSCAPPHYSGWWFDIHPKRKDGLSDPSFVIDYYTSTNLQAAAYLGAERPLMGVFVVDQGGAPRVYVGPVARAFGQPGPITPRLTDADASRLPTHTAPWRASYEVHGPAEPPLLVKADRPVRKRGDRTVSWDLDLVSTRDLGTVAVTVLDHHRRKIATLEKPVGTKSTTFAFKVPADREVAGVFVRVNGSDFGWVPPKEKEIDQGLTFALGAMRADLEKERAKNAAGD